MAQVHDRGAVILLAVCLAATVAVADPGRATVGDLLVEVARLRDLPAEDARSAQRALEGSGVSLAGMNADQALTEGEVARVLSALGVQVTTSRPDLPVDAEALDGVLSALGPEIVSPRSESLGAGGPYPRPNDSAADPATKGKKNGTSKGKGKKKGHGQVSPSTPI